MSDSSLTEATSSSHGGHEAVECEVDRPKNAVILAAVVAIIAVVMIVVAGVFQYFGFVLRAEQTRKTEMNPNAPLRELRAREQARLSAYQWVSEKDGVVRIPVAEAKALVLREWAARSPANVPVAGSPSPALSASAAAPSGSAAPASSAAPAGSAAH